MLDVDRFGVLCVRWKALHCGEINQREGKRLEEWGEKEQEEGRNGRALHRMAPAVTAGHQLPGEATKTTEVDVTVQNVKKYCEESESGRCKRFMLT